MDPPTSDILAALNRIARSHFDWTAESFVRVLALAEWGEREVSTTIDAEYKREIPRLYRAIERIDELGGRAAMSFDGDYARYLPRVGRNLTEMLARERDSLSEFQPELRQLGEMLGNAGEEIGASIARDAHATRASYLDWVSGAMAADARRDSSQSRSGRSALSALSALSNWDRELAPAPADEAPAWNALKNLYALFSPAIEETVVHMLLLHRAGRSEAASATWRDSWAYMLYAAEVVRLLAGRGWAMDFGSADVLPELAPPAVAASADQAIHSNEQRREALRAALGALAKLGDAEVNSICSNATRYLHARSRGEPGEPPRETPNFEAMLERESFNPAQA